MSSRYSRLAKATASAVRGQSASQNLERNPEVTEAAEVAGPRAPPAAHLADTLVVKLAQLLAYISLVVPVMSSHWAGAVPPITLQRRRRLVVSPSPASRGLSRHDGGRGIRSPMGRWNLRRRGSMVTTGLKVAWLPSWRVSSSSGIG